MRVGDRMTRTQLTVKPWMALKAASELLHRHRIRHLLVTDQGRLVGIVTEQDIRRALQLGATRLKFHELLYLLDTVRVQDIMITEVISVTPDTPVEEAARIMVEKRIGCLPVLKGETLVGIVTRDDLLAALVDSVGAWSTPGRLEAA